MGDTPAVTNSFAPNTRARATAVNQNFADLIQHLSSGTSDLFNSSYSNSRLTEGDGNGDLTIGDAQCLIGGYFQLNTGDEWTLSTTTSKLVSFGQFQIHSSATLRITKGSVVIP